MLYAPQQDNTALVAMLQKRIDKNKADFGDKDKDKENVTIA